MNVPEALAWIAVDFDTDPDTIRPETERTDITGWDSMGVLALMAGLDNEFGILLSADDMWAMTKVEDIMEALRKNGKLE